MIIPTYEFYRNVYHGRMIEAAGDFAYYAERAGDELALFASTIPCEGQRDVQRCICAVAEILADEASTSQHGQPVASESVNGYYSVNFGGRVSSRSRIDKALRTYLGRWMCRPVGVTE